MSVRAFGVRALGDRALIVDLPDLRWVLALNRVLASSRPAGVEDVVPAARTLAALVDPRRLSLDAARTWLERGLSELSEASGSSERSDWSVSSNQSGPSDHSGRSLPSAWSSRSPRSDLLMTAVVDGTDDASTNGAEVVIDVVYDGDDLDELERLTGVAPDELIRRHTAALWRVAFGGFAPGFGYLVTDDEWFDVPRRASPRTRVPAGSVALAGGFSGIYPREGAGGWQLIGRTDAPLWRPRESRPALLTPGTVVTFRPVRAIAPPAAADSTRSASADSVGSPSAVTTPVGAAPVVGAPALTVLRAGAQLLIEDLGRPGFASVGAGRSGALDRGALRLGNRLVGNVEAAAGLEVVVGAELRFEQPTWFAVTGARGALRLGGHPIEPDAAVRASAGQVLQLSTAERGLRYTVAMRGGVAVALELGSASSDIGAGIGPSALADGDVIALGGDIAGGIPAVDALTVPSPQQDEVDVHVVAGPRQEWFAPASVAAFYDVEWEVTSASNRVGMRLRSADGVALARSDDPALPAELPSEPMVPGAVQVPPSGEPTVLLADGPVTGGYPVIAVVTDADLDLFAQLRPGQRLRFRHSRPH